MTMPGEEGARSRPKSEKIRPLNPVKGLLNRRRVASHDTNEEMLKIAVSNKAFDLEVTVEELEEMEANEPAKPLFVTPLTPSPNSSATGREEEQSSNLRMGSILRAVAASFIFLAILYLLSLASYQEPTGVENSAITEVLRRLKAPMGADRDAVAGVEEMQDQLAEEITKELRQEIQAEVHKQLREIHREMLD